MENKTLAEKLRELRQEADLSVREAARRCSVSAPFLSDIELGRRNPSADVLARLAKLFRVKLDDLKQYDARDSLSSIKRLMDSSPSWGFALRKVAERASEGKISPEELLKIR